LAAGGFGKAVAICDSGTGKELLLLDHYHDLVTVVAFSHDGRTLAAGEVSGRLNFRDAEDSRERFTLRAHGAMIQALSYDKTGRRLATASVDMIGSGVGEVRLWDTADGREMLELPGEGCVAFSTDGRRLAASARGAVLGVVPTQFVRIWDFSPSPLDATLARISSTVFTVASDRTGRFLAFTSQPNELTIWDRTQRKAVTTIENLDSAVVGLDFSPDGTQLAMALGDRIVRLWDLKTQKPIQTFVGHEGQVRRVKFEPTGTRLISASADRTVRQWDVASGKQLWRVDHGAFVADLSLSPDGSRVAVCGGTSVRILDAASGQPVKELTVPSPGWGVVLGSDILAVSSADGIVRLWDAKTWSECGQLKGHTGTVWSVAIRDRLLASAGEDRTVRTWSLDTLAPIATFSGHFARVRGVFAGDGWLATASYDGTVRLWNPSALQP
jgi:WD40 repeat protein